MLICNTWPFHNLNLFCIYYLIMSVAILLPAILILHELGGKIMGKIKEIYLFGKVKSLSAETKKTFIWSNLCAVPKRWFLHFYVFGALVHGSVVISAVVLPLMHQDKLGSTVSSLNSWLQWPCYLKDPTGSLAPLLTVLFLAWLQMLRRAGECAFVSVWSPGTMSVMHYAAGIIFYTTFGLGVLSSVSLDALVLPSSTGLPIEEYGSISVGICMFVTASFFQHKSMKTFAALRSDVKEKSIKSHYIPRGHLFLWVSCPHYLCEIIIYISFCVISQGHNIFLLCITLFVIINQICAGLLSHKWYLCNFPRSYPKERKAIIPFLL